MTWSEHQVELPNGDRQVENAADVRWRAQNHEALRNHASPGIRIENRVDTGAIDKRSVSQVKNDDLRCHKSLVKCQLERRGGVAAGGDGEREAALPFYS